MVGYFQSYCILATSHFVPSSAIIWSLQYIFHTKCDPYYEQVLKTFSLLSVVVMCGLMFFLKKKNMASHFFLFKNNNNTKVNDIHRSSDFLTLLLINSVYILALAS